MEKIIEPTTKLQYASRADVERERLKLYALTLAENEVLVAKLDRAEKLSARRAAIIKDMENNIRAGRIDLDCEDCGGEGEYETLECGDPDSGKRRKCKCGDGSIIYICKAAK